MFHHRSSAFGPSVNAIQQHLGAVEKELETIGRIAGRRTSSAAATAGEQIGDTVSALLNDMLDRFRRGGATAREGAVRYGNEAAEAGARYGSGALARMSAEVEERPLLTLGVALGVGVLIGAAVLTNLSAGGSPARKRNRR
jgi:hypothetical protein